MVCVGDWLIQIISKQINQYQAPGVEITASLLTWPAKF